MPKYFLLSCCFYLSLISTFAQSWSSADYSKFDWKSFYKLSTAHQELNLSDIDYPLLHAAIFYVSNEFRERNRLKPFIYSDRIERLSADHAADMVKYNISSTAAIQYEYGRKVNRPQSPGIFTYMSNKREVIPNHTYLSYAKAIVQLWMDSPGHRANILNPGFIYMAAGSAVYPERSFYNMPYFMNVQCFSGR